MSKLAPLWPFGRSRAAADAALLLGAMTEASRQPALFGENRIADTLTGRLDSLSLHACLALFRLGREPNLAPLAQAFTDLLFRQIDAGLREDGVGDLTVPKRMRRIAGEFYARLKAYEPGLTGGTAALNDALARHMAVAEEFAPALAAYAGETARTQGDAPAHAMFGAQGWRSAPA